MAKTSKTTVRVACLKAWMVENKFLKVKLSTSKTPSYERK